MILATAFTGDYERAGRYVSSLKEHCNIPFHPMLIGKDMPDYGMPRSIVQGGHFLEHLPPCKTIIFTDADVVMHRPIDDDEIDFISGIGEGQISACYNMRKGQLLGEEVPLLFPRGSLTGFDDVRVFNTGFVIANRATYEMLFERFKALWPSFDEAFGHYAKIQLCMCAAAHQLGLEWVPVPGHLCSHGHFGTPEGVIPSNPPTFNGRIIAFDHRIT